MKYEFINNKSESLSYRRKLRNEPTPQEIMLWARLKNNGTGFKFRRQHGIGKYILDFYCPSKKLAIEIDGSQHQDNENYDRMRDDLVSNFGIKTLRFWNNEINTNIEGVLMKIGEELGTTL